MFGRLARLVTARAWLVLFCTLLVVVDGVLLGSGLGGRLRGEGLSDPASESAMAQRILEQDFPATQANFALLVQSDREINDRGVARAGIAVAEQLAAEPSVDSVTSFWTSAVAELRSRDGKKSLILAHIDGTPEQARVVFDRIAPKYRGSRDGLTLRVGGSLAVQAEIESTIGHDLARAEMIALPIVFLLLVIVFGSVVAALLPLVVGGVSIVGTNAALAVIAGCTDVSVFAQNLTTALGLGLAIDYALLLLRRYRDELAHGVSTREAVTTTLRTAGRTVAFSAVVIGVALAVLVVFPQYFLRSFAYAGIPVVLLAAGSALVVLPACLMLLGRRIDALDLVAPIRRRLRRAGGGITGGIWYRSATGVMRRAPLFAIGAIAVLVVLGLPFAGARFGTADQRQLPSSAESRLVADTVRDEFASSVTGTITVAVQGASDAELASYAEAVSALDHVDEVTTPVGLFRHGRLDQAPTVINSLQRDGTVAYLSVHPVPEVGAISPETIGIVSALHKLDPPFRAGAAGQVATLVDSQDAIARRLPVVALVIVLVTFALLFLLTGGILVSALALISNALSLLAMFGAVIWVFGQGHLAGVFGFQPTGYVDTFLPVLMFCLAFGLSMDYGVFLLARVREEYDRTGDHRHAVAAGLQGTGGIITAAALILAVVLAAVGTSRITNSMMLGWGTSLAVLVDATLVRCVLVPAVLALTGERAWWAPTPLRRLHQRIGRHSGVGDEPTAPSDPTEIRVPVPAPGGADFR